ncbi:hypothetical protein C8J56DRAFT_1053280 [Mycena floridula]|nr:hypothetical protein C8J56DRAFT_1053280 [Mycena floridula]
MHIKLEPVSSTNTSRAQTLQPSPKKSKANNEVNLLQATDKFLGIQDVYDQAMKEITGIRDQALGSLIQDFNQTLSQSPSRARVAVVDVDQLSALQQYSSSQESDDIWGGMSSPPQGYRTPQPSPSRARPAPLEYQTPQPSPSRARPA